MSHEAAPATAPGGWYPDPHNQTQWRWWDGVQWTGHCAPMETAPAAHVAEVPLQDQPLQMQQHGQQFVPQRHVQSEARQEVAPAEVELGVTPRLQTMEKRSRPSLGLDGAAAKRLVVMLLVVAIAAGGGWWFVLREKPIEMPTQPSTQQPPGSAVPSKVDSTYGGGVSQAQDIASTSAQAQSKQAAAEVQVE